MARDIDDVLSTASVKQIQAYCREIRDAAWAAQATEDRYAGQLMYGSVAVAAITLSSWATTAASWHRRHKRRSRRPAVKETSR
jgi:hypothetical protein